MSPSTAIIFFIRSVFHVHFPLHSNRMRIFSHVNWRMFVESLAFMYTRLAMRTKQNFSCGGLELSKWYTIVDRNPRDGDAFINPSWSVMLRYESSRFSCTTKKRAATWDSVDLDRTVRRPPRSRVSTTRAKGNQSIKMFQFTNFPQWPFSRVAKWV